MISRGLQSELYLKVHGGLQMLGCDESKPYIFVSYSHRDGARVLEIIDHLRDEGYNVWWDDGIDPGTEWDENIAYHIQNCSYFIAFISEGYIESKNCKDEINYSRDLDKEQLLVYLDDVNLPAGMAMRMNRLQAIWWNRYDKNNLNNAYIKLFNAKGIGKTKILDKGEELGNVGVSMTEAVDINDSSIKRLRIVPKFVLPVSITVCVLILVAIIVVLIVTSMVQKPEPDSLNRETNSIAAATHDSDVDNNESKKSTEDISGITKIMDYDNQIYDFQNNVIWGFNGTNYQQEILNDGAIYAISDDGKVEMSYIPKSQELYEAVFQSSDMYFDKHNNDYYNYVQDVDSPVGNAKLYKIIKLRESFVSIHYFILVQGEKNGYIALWIDIDRGVYSNYGSTELAELEITVTQNNIDEVFLAYDKGENIKFIVLREYAKLFE